jgi:putative PIN family toxin of toxin-antitoxin system
MHKVIIDTNVFLSGILFGGNPRKIIQLWLDNKFILCLSPELKAEILGKLKRKFALPPKELQSIEEALDTKSNKFMPKTKLNICRDPQDNFLFELAYESKADFIISGDKLVLELEKYKNTKIITPKKFLDV